MKEAIAVRGKGAFLLKGVTISDSAPDKVTAEEAKRVPYPMASSLPTIPPGMTIS